MQETSASSKDSNENGRTTIAVCTRILPNGDRNTSFIVVNELTTIVAINRWCDELCAGDAVRVNLELVEQYIPHQ